MSLIHDWKRYVNCETILPQGSGSDAYHDVSVLNFIKTVEACL